MKLSDQSNILKKMSRDLQNFCDYFGDKIPEDFFSPSINIGDESTSSITLSCNLLYVAEPDRDAALTLIGDLFGRQGWVATQTNSSWERPRLDWTKQSMGIKLQIIGAKFLPAQPKEVPVMPSEFPVLLRDKEDSEELPPL